MTVKTDFSRFEPSRVDARGSGGSLRASPRGRLRLEAVRVLGLPASLKAFARCSELHAGALRPSPRSDRLAAEVAATATSSLPSRSARLSVLGLDEIPRAESPPASRGCCAARFVRGTMDTRPPARYLRGFARGGWPDEHSSTPARSPQRVPDPGREGGRPPHYQTTLGPARAPDGRPRGPTAVPGGGPPGPYLPGFAPDPRGAR